MSFTKQLLENIHIVLLVAVALSSLVGLMTLYDDMSITAHPVWTNYPSEMETPDAQCPADFPYITPLKLARAQRYGSICRASNVKEVFCCKTVA